jgi:hypothetical protein
MGVIIKYQLQFPETKLKISNDVLEGDFIIDAEIRAEMMRGTLGAGFEIKLHDLPQDEAQKLYDEFNKNSGKLSVRIKLGYFDGDFEPVMKGVVEKISSTVHAEKLVTTIKGSEIGTHALKQTKFKDLKESLSGTLTMQAPVKKLLEKTKGEIDKEPEITGIPEDSEYTDKVQAEENALEALGKIAKEADAELLVCDSKVRMGKPIKDAYKLDELDRDTNLAEFQPFTKNIPDESGRNILNPLKARTAQGFEFTVIGNPKMRPAQELVTKEIKGFDDKAEATFRIHSVVHNYSTSGGYTCRGVAMKECEGEGCNSQEHALKQPSPAAIAQSLAQKAKSEQSRKPAIEIGKIKTYMAKQHLGTLYYGQRYEPTETQPSIRTEVDTDEKQLLQNKPVLSPFAWHKCGLVTPIYPGMKALVNHNLNMRDDAVIMGFIWSENPEIKPPENNEGDWWLCLPIDVSESSPPGDSTKAANDLIANNGKRVIELKGLKITVGKDKVSNVGERPSEGAEDEFLIEHTSGTKFQIAPDGKIMIKGDVIIEGNVEIK